jgi:hypothetical protein
MTLLSDGSMNHFSSNTQSSFRIKLPKAIDIKKGQWDMAVVEMILPSQVYNVSKEESQFKIVSKYKGLIRHMLELSPPSCETDGDSVTYPLCITPGAYHSAEQLVGAINDAIQKNVGEALKVVNCQFDMRYSTLAKRVKFAKHVKEDVRLRFHPGMLAKLGASAQKDILPRDDLAFTHDVDLYAGINHMFIYSDVADFTLLGDVQAPILRVVPFQESHQIHVHKEFLNLHYVPISKPYFDEIGIHIRGDTGELIQFSGGKSMIKLHFKKREYYI